MRYEVELVFVADGHPAADATVTAVAELAGATVGPVTMQPTGADGHYTATLTFPSAGQWNVRFTGVTQATLRRATLGTDHDVGLDHDSRFDHDDRAQHHEHPRPPRLHQPFATEQSGDEGGSGTLVVAISAVAIATAIAFTLVRRRAHGQSS